MLGHRSQTDLTAVVLMDVGNGLQNLRTVLFRLRSRSVCRAEKRWLDACSMMKTQFFLTDGITDAFDSFHDLIMGSNADTGNVIAKLVQKTDEILDYPGGQYTFFGCRH